MGCSATPGKLREPRMDDLLDPEQVVSLAALVALISYTASVARKVTLVDVTPQDGP
ncbi:hypothetical protein [Streptomyces longisporoflavus]|uniref:Uncharacterized protein n=1 Tax=Streptomyces longisporoflavus TaxID=28044 RepID=A0ABW7QT94_9ACTN|nr:hypothetical protein [Streptomyces longisporoflavus]GGV65322.1 hypothetical protein GCM10010277_72500 [Streptomyces longisporoflavus]